MTKWMRNRRPALSAVLAGSLLVPWFAAGAEPVKRTGVMVPTSDGVKLATDVHLPEEGTAFPTVVVRTPYGRNMPWVAEPMVRAGYAVALQDVRGMNGSEGQFIPFIHEKQDGLDTLGWVAEQSWCNGSIGMWGSSYMGFCALVVAPDAPANLKAIVNISGWGDTQEMVAPGGAMHLMVALPWTLSNQIHGRGSFREYDWDTAFRHVPVVEIPKALGVESPAWAGAVELFTGDVLSQLAGITGRYDKITAPVLHITGWYDFLARHTLDVYSGLAEADGPPQKLIVGPWYHDGIWRDHAKVGDVDFGSSAVMGHEQAIAHSIRWLDRWLSGKKAEDNGKGVRLFVMGADQWREFDRYPPENVHWQKWYFGSDGRANSSTGSGVLSTEPKGEAWYDRFTHNPANPVPTTGGANFHFFKDNLGVMDQRRIELREDVLVYTSEPLAAPLEIVGPVTAVVWGSTKGEHADFTAKLVDVRPDGYAAIIADGIQRGPDPKDGEHLERLNPGTVYRFTIDLGDTAIRLGKGHRLRVEVSSTNFPKYTVNPATGEAAETATHRKAVEQTVLYSTRYRSHIILPVVMAP